MYCYNVCYMLCINCLLLGEWVFNVVSLSFDWGFGWSEFLYDEFLCVFYV